MKTHSKECSQPQKPCTANKTIHGEKSDEHWWSGWPGAFCMKCGDDDKMELCLADVCECHCHDEFYKELDDYMDNQREFEKLKKIKGGLIK